MCVCVSSKRTLEKEKDGPFAHENEKKSKREREGKERKEEKGMRGVTMILPSEKEYDPYRCLTEHFA